MGAEHIQLLAVADDGQSSVVAWANTENSTKRPSFRIICIPWVTEDGWPVASI